MKWAWQTGIAMDDSLTVPNTSLPTAPAVASPVEVSPSQPERVGPVFIYTLSDPRNGEIRYVGRAKNLHERLKYHLWDRNNSHKVNWIKSLKAEGMTPKIEELETVTEAEWQGAERFWIASLRFLGCRLTNGTIGGDGVIGFNKGRPLPKEQRIKIGLANKGKTRSEALRAAISKKLTGRKQPKEFCEAMSKRMTGSKRPASEALRIANKAKMVGRKLSPEWRMAISKANKGHAISKETRLKISRRVSQTLTGRKASMETRMRMSISAKAVWSNKRSTKTPELNL